MKKLSLVGGGINPMRDVTLGALQRMKEADVVCHFRKKGLTDLFKSHNVLQTCDVTDLYLNGGLDIDNYRSIYVRILQILKNNSKVAYVELGHPRVGITLTEDLIRAAAQQDYEVEILPGISSFDTMIIDAGLDPLERGTTLLDANRLLLYRPVLSDTCNLFIYHVCSVGVQRTNYRDPSEGNRIDLLVENLLQWYKPDHKCFILSSDNGTGQIQRIEIRLEKLLEMAGHISYASTLFLPARQNEKYDRVFLSVLRMSAAS